MGGAYEYWWELVLYAYFIITLLQLFIQPLLWLPLVE